MTDYDLGAFTRDVTSARDDWRKDTRWPCGAEARLDADLDYRQAVRGAAERFLAATRAALARQVQYTTAAVSEQNRLAGQLDAARQALDEATDARDEALATLAELQEALASHVCPVVMNAAPEPPPAPPVGDAPAKQAPERARTARVPRTAPRAGARKAGTATEAPRDAK